MICTTEKTKSKALFVFVGKLKSRDMILFADMDFNKFLTRLALYRAAPDKFTIALFLNVFPYGIITSSTAHCRTPIRTMTGSITFTIFCTEGSNTSIVFTEVRIFKVD